MAIDSGVDLVQRLDLKGFSTDMIQLHIMRLFLSDSGRLHLECIFDDDPHEALASMGRHCPDWDFKRLAHGRWLLRNHRHDWHSPR